jgi:hypothetical protein
MSSQGALFNGGMSLRFHRVTSRSEKTCSLAAAEVNAEKLSVFCPCSWYKSEQKETTLASAAHLNGADVRRLILRVPTLRALVSTGQSCQTVKSVGYPFGM